MKFDKRVKLTNDKVLNKDGEYVVYWMQNAMRVEYNHALNYAVKRANLLGKPLLVIFVINLKYPEATTRHYKFMLEGLSEVRQELKDKNIKISFLIGDALDCVLDVCEKASFLVAEKGYLKHEIEIRKKLSSKVNIPMFEVETNVIVPVEEVSNKEEYAAYTIRPKINKLISYYALELESFEINKDSLNLKVSNEIEFNVEDIMKLLSVFEDKYSSEFKGGISEARRYLDDFIKNKLNFYEEKRNDPSLDYQSNMSMYLHFGQISPLEIYLKTKDEKNSDHYIEELVVRRELSYNFVYYNKNYDNYRSLPNWALETLEDHSRDNRKYIYTLEELENFNTHDTYWNACQKQMVTTGKMHGYMRMYWGKKIIEWSNDYKEAYKVLIYLNNKYNIDGRGPNAYAGVAWCFGKHDRPWFEREIFGKVRYMNENGLKRKFDMESYLKKIGEKRQ